MTPTARIAIAMLACASLSGCGRVGYEASATGDAGRVDAASEVDASGRDGAPSPDASADGGARPCATRPWAYALGNAAFQELFAVAAAADGSIYAAGHFEGTLGLVDGTVSAVGEQDVLVVRFDSAGAMRSGFSFGGPTLDTAWGVDADAAGNVYVAGSTTGGLDFGDGPIPSRGGISDAFIASFAPDGSVRWGHVLGAAGVDNARAIVAGRDSVYVTGGFEDTVSIGSEMITASNGVDIFVGKIGRDGAVDWLRGFGGLDNDVGYDVALQSSGNVIATGWVYGDVDFGGGVRPAAGFEDIFVLSLDPGGAHAWSFRSSGAGAELGQAVAVDADDNTYVAAIYGGGDIRLLGRSHATFGDWDGAVFSLDPGGGVRWSTVFGSVNGDMARGVAVGAGPTGPEVTISGYFAGAVDLDRPLMPAATDDLLVAELDPADGQWRSSTQLGGGVGAVSFNVAGRAGCAFAVGQLRGTIDVGAGPVDTMGDADALIVGLPP